MRSYSVQATSAVRNFLQKDTTRGILFIRNIDTVNTIFVQTGDSPGSTSDFFPILPGETLTLDPHQDLHQIVQDMWWIYAPVGTPNCIVFSG